MGKNKIVPRQGSETAVPVNQYNNYGDGPQIARVDKYIDQSRKCSPDVFGLLSRERYHLFVLENEDFGAGSFSIRKDNCFHHMDKEDKTRYVGLDYDGIEEKKGFPAILLNRNHSHKCAGEQRALLVKIEDIVDMPGGLRFKFIQYEWFDQQQMNDNEELFGLFSAPLRNELDEVHWSIKRKNLFDIMQQLGIRI